MTEIYNAGDRVGLETRNIFLDTEVFRSYDHNLNAKHMKVLGGYIADGVFVLHTTDVTLREVCRQLGDMERKLTNRANKVSKELTRWNSRYRSDQYHLPVPDPLGGPGDPSRAYRDFEWVVRHDWQANEHPSFDLPIGPVLDRYFNRQAPFETEGSKEFPDAFALLALEQWCAARQERIYVVSKDKAVLRAADESDLLIGIESLDRLFALVASAEDHEMTDAVSAVFEERSLLNELRDSLSSNIGWLGCIYVGDLPDGEVLSMEIVELEDSEDVIILRVDQDQVACVAIVKLLISAEISYTDLSFAIWDGEDKRYYGGESAVTEIQSSVAAKVFVELARDVDLTLSSAQFVTQNLTVKESYSDG